MEAVSYTHLDVYKRHGLDSAILMNPQTWVASGHLGGLSDPLMDCRECKERFRADKLIEDWCAEEGFELEKPIDAFTQEEMKNFIEEHNIPFPSCGKHNFTDIRQFNLMFKTFQGVTDVYKRQVISAATTRNAPMTVRRTSSAPTACPRPRSAQSRAL